MKKTVPNLFPSEIKDIVLFDPSTVLTSRILLFKKLITYLAIALISVHVQAQIKHTQQQTTPTPLNIGYSSNYYFDDYKDNTGAINSSNQISDKAQVRQWKDSGAVYVESDNRYNCHAWAWYLMGTLNGVQSTPWPIDISEYEFIGLSRPFTCNGPGTDPPCYSPDVYWNSGVYTTTTANN
jgi:hypothetical protein